MEWVFSLLGAFLITVVVTPILIPFLRYLKFGQSILEVGPVWHISKQGTPTIGGIAVILAILVVQLIFFRTFTSFAIYIFSLLFGLIGLADDLLKIVNKRNLGLTSSRKFLAQTGVTLAFMLFLHMYGYNTQIIIPFLATPIEIPFLYLPFSVFVILGVVNSVNLTDGLDGLASSVTIIVALFCAAAASKLGFDDVSILLAGAVGGCLGFLIHNAHPARVFMGDTGSLFLGGLLATSATVLGIQLFLVIAGLIYLLETLSVILQVYYYKKRRKRLFKMAPLHHHFELLGWSENKIVLRFSFLTILMCVIAYVGVAA